MADISLLLDEHYPATLAASLTARGVDTQAVISRDDLRGRDDRSVLAAATHEGRIVVTEDVTTFPAAMAMVPQHSGVIFCESRRFPRTLSALPRLESALVEFASNPPDTARFPGFVWWLDTASEE